MDIGQLFTDTHQPHSETHMATTSDPQHSPHLEPSSDPYCDPRLDPHLDLSSDPHPDHICSDPHLEPRLDLYQEPSSELCPNQSSHDRFLAEQVTDKEGDEAYVSEADSSECESKPESVVSKALRRLRKRSIETAGTNI